MKKLEKVKEKIKEEKCMETQNDLFRHIKNSTTGITLVALVCTIVVLLILAGITITMLFGENGIIKKAQDAANATEKGQADEIEGLDSLADQMGDALGEGSKVGFNKTKGMNAPRLGTEMVPVRWDLTEKAWYVCKEDNSDGWYDYANQNWANIMMRDGLTLDDGTEAGMTVTNETALDTIVGKKVKTVGSMFVWIPRYAYNIASGYHTGGEGINGTINIEFLQGTTDLPANESTKIVEYNSTTTEDYTKFPDGYVVHPAFNYGQRISGLWIAKFEASKLGATTDTTNESLANNNKTDITLQVKPSVTSWRYINIGNMYTVCLNYNTSLNSHMMKNIEWGAVAYFSHSKYGRNRTEISQNQCTSYITGAGPGAGESTISNSTYAYDETTFLDETNGFAYTTTRGQLASSTGTVTGIYDLSGGTYEYVAAYMGTGNAMIAAIVNGENKTKDVYIKTSENTRISNYEANKGKYGDAIWETSAGTYDGNDTNTIAQSWNGDYSYFLYGTMVCFYRGCNYAINGASAGSFLFNHLNGRPTAVHGFRPVLVTL